MALKFKVGQVIASKYDEAALIYEVKLVGGHPHYSLIRLCNGERISYTEASIKNFFVVSENPAAEILYGR